MRRLVGFVGICLGLTPSLLLGGCGGTSTGNPGSDPTASVSEIAESSLSGAINSTEPGGSQAYRSPSAERMRWYQGLASELSLLPRASYASGLCHTLATASCSGGVMTATYDSCSFLGSLSVWNGSQSIAFSGGCPSPMTLANLNGQTLTRTFGAGTTIQNLLGVTTTIDTTTAASSGWDTSVSVSGEGQVTTFTDAAGSRTVTILGVHYSGSWKGRVLYDHTVSSTAVSVTGSGTSRTVSGGTITVQHNKLRYTASAQISTALAYSISGCCHPASGTITSTLSGSVTGTETLTFTGATTGTCGSATLTGSDGLTKSLTLNQCL